MSARHAYSLGNAAQTIPMACLTRSQETIVGRNAIRGPLSYLGIVLQGFEATVPAQSAFSFHLTYKMLHVRFAGLSTQISPRSLLALFASHSFE